MEIIALQGHRKEGSGKVETKKIRRNGQVPAVLYKSGGGDAIQCRSACAPGQPDLLALPGLRATVDARSEHLAMILRSDDPATAREAMHRAELLLRR